MFQIKKYLHYKNTPDGKPRVLTEGVDYIFKTLKHLSNRNIGKLQKGQSLFESIAWLEDCRPLLTVENVSELSVWLVARYLNGPEYAMLFYFNGVSWIKYTTINGEDDFNITNIDYFQKGKLVNFYDDPAKYSQLLWNCSEEEGWKKVLNLLNV
jgi:hypothetical protein